MATSWKLPLPARTEPKVTKMTDSAGPTIAETDKPMKNSDVAFLLPGQGAFYPGVLRHLSEHYPEVRDILQEMDEPVRAMLGCSVTAALLEEEPRSIENWLANLWGARSPHAL